ncbi:PilW family protein [Nitrincola alkalilacustris]|uniref:PilW family protein n=1 Tax=Nitrincola alkalilacustris TaxID=1571224 RepID=UPI00124CF52C|nr:prepilin-type N-terminal cleavage/methylation domain-containing protein [Nitrincola alkalilacustris]
MVAMYRHKPLMPQKGFSLVELLVGLLISLFLVGGLLSVFSANQQSSQVKRNLDSAQEAFRFASFTISRIVRLGGGDNPDDPMVLSAATDDELSVSFAIAPGVTDCLGLPITGTGTAVNRFFLDGENLRCENSTGQTATLVSGVADMTIRYGVPGIDQWVEDGDFLLAADMSSDDWMNTTSVRVTLAMVGSGLESTFVTAGRSKLVAQHGGGSGGNGSGGGGTAPGGNDGGDGSGEGDGSDNGDDNPGNGDDGNNGGGDDDQGNGDGLPNTCQSVVTGTVHHNVNVMTISAIDNSASGMCSIGNKQQSSRSFTCSISAVEDEQLRLTRNHGSPSETLVTADCGNQTVTNW